MPTHGNVRRRARHSPHRDIVTGLLLAHQGGWDETLLVLVPIAVIVALLQVARRRTKQP
jgi:hypothetical protein